MYSMTCLRLCKMGISSTNNRAYKKDWIKSLYTYFVMLVKHKNNFPSRGSIFSFVVYACPFHFFHFHTSFFFHHHLCNSTLTLLTGVFEKVKEKKRKKTTSLKYMNKWHKKPQECLLNTGWRTNSVLIIQIFSLLLLVFNITAVFNIIEVFSTEVLFPYLY